MATLIKDPVQLQNEFQKVGDQLNRITPFEKIPVNIRSDLMAILSAWSDTYEGSSWGAAAATLDTSVTMPAKDIERWNNNLVAAQSLVKKAAASPGVQVLLDIPTPAPVPINQQPIVLPELKITGKVPWYFGAACIAGLGLLVSILSKKKTRIPRPVL